MNEKDIKAFKWTKDRQIPLGDCLYLHLRKSSKTYTVRKRIKGKQSVKTLGKHPEMSLRQARMDAQTYSMSGLVSNRIVSELVDKYWTEVIVPTSKVPKQVEGYFNNIKAEFGRDKLGDITRSMLVSYIQDYSTERGARSADRMRSYLIQVFSYAVELGYLDTSPMSLVTKRITGYISRARKRVLSNEEIKDMWHWKNAESGWQKTEENTRVIKFLLLTGLRISEAQKGYIDGDKFRVDDTKGKHSKDETRPHWVYLTETAKSLLPLPRCTDTNIQAWLKRKLIKEKVEPRYTPHDCRRTFATMASDIKVAPFIVEKCLNHRMSGMLAVYNHAEYEAERIEAAKAIEKKILEIINEQG